MLTASILKEPEFLSAQAPIPSQNATEFYTRMFNAYLDLYDDQGRPLPYLAEALPVLNTDSWVILPDGRMETRYRLKPNLVWHDGTPLTADDFAFAFQAASPAKGFRTGVVPYTAMENVLAPDDRSIVIRWKSIYPDAGVLLGAARFGLVPLPRHILEEVSGQPTDVLQGHPYWAREFVGATLDREERIQQRAQMAKLISDEVPAIPLTYSPNNHAYVAAVKNVGPVSPQTTGRMTWNIERWELQ